jgi:hypothetical protein
MDDAIVFRCGYSLNQPFVESETCLGSSPPPKALLADLRGGPGERGGPGQWSIHELDPHVINWKLRLPDLSHEPCRTLVISDDAIVEERNPPPCELCRASAKARIGETRRRPASGRASTSRSSKQSMCQRFHLHHLSSEGL